MATQLHCLTLDLQDDPALIDEYEAHHRAVWPEVRAHLHAAGVIGLKLWRRGTRLVMWLEVDEHFSFEHMATLEAHNPEVQAWEALMWRFQQPLPDAPAGSKWQPMASIFDFQAGD